MTHYYYNKLLLHNKNILLHHHLGLGDHIVLNGLVNYVSENQDIDKNIFLLCKENNLENVKRLYENNKNIIVVSTKNIDEYQAAKIILSQNDFEYLKIGHETYSEDFEKKNNWDCGQVFYYLANIPYHYRYEKFQLNINKEKCEEVFNYLNPEKKQFIFVHDDPKRNYNLNIKSKYYIIRNDINFSIYDYITVFQHAEEIHLMPSSFYCLIESIPNIKAKLFFYDNIRKSNFGSVQRYKWEIIDSNKI